MDKYKVRENETLDQIDYLIDDYLVNPSEENKKLILDLATPLDSNSFGKIIDIINEKNRISTSENKKKLLKLKSELLIIKSDKINEQKEIISNLPFEVSMWEVKFKRLVVSFKKTKMKNSYKETEVDYLKREWWHFELKFRWVEDIIKIYYFWNKISFLFNWKERVYPVEIESWIVMKDRYNITKIHQIKKPIDVDLWDVRFSLNFSH